MVAQGFMSLTIRLDKATVAYFKGLADEIGMRTRI